MNLEHILLSTVLPITSVSVLQEKVTPCCDDLVLTYVLGGHFLWPCCFKWTSTHGPHDIALRQPMNKPCGQRLLLGLTAPVAAQNTWAVASVIYNLWLQLCGRRLVAQIMYDHIIYD